MSFFSVLILDTILIVFPIICVLLAKANLKNTNNIDNEFLIDLANFASLFLLIKYCDYGNHYSVILVNIPLVISLINNRKGASIVIAFILILFSIYYGYNYIYVCLEYFIYILVFVVIFYKNKTYAKIIFPFILIKGTFLTIYEFYILGNNNFSSITKVFIALTVFYLVGALTVNIVALIEKMVDLNTTLRELEKEQELKNSLFKITHEVKNPISVCKGYLSMMNYEDIDKVKKYDKIIMSELDRTLDIMDNFSEYTKINVNLDIMDVDSLITDTIKSMDMMFLSNNITVSYKEGEEIFINGDYNRLKQVLVNILKNSVEAIKKNGNISIKCKQGKKYVTIAIRDDGPGIDEEEIKKIDQLFYSSKEKGCGIGVSLSKEIIKLHNGTIKYKSVVEQYTEALVKLPIVNIDI